jgi:uncharacterized iron-regulated membrane protein
MAEVTTSPERPPATAAPPPSRARRPRLRRYLLGQRTFVWQIHKWLSLVLLAWILLESVTGSALVFAPEIDRWWNRDEYAATSGDIGIDSAVDAAQDARPGEPVRLVYGPGSLGPMYEVFTVGDDSAPHRVLVDPGSGDVTTDDYEEAGFVLLVERLHFNLNSTSILGVAATTIVGWLAVGWLLILISGFWVWYWPRIKRWARALRVRGGRGRLIFNVDLHNAIGIATILPLTLIVLTGINFMFPNQVRDTYEVLTFGLYDDRDTTAALSEPTGGESITTGEAEEIVSDLDPAIDVQYVETPSGSPVGEYSVWAHVDDSFIELVGGQRDVEFEVDQYTGRIIKIRDPLDDNGVTQAYADWSYPLHVGTFGGAVTRWLWLVIGLIPVALAWTGVVIWLTRRRKRTKAGDDPPPRETPTLPDEILETTS